MIYLLEYTPHGNTAVLQLKERDSGRGEIICVLDNSYEGQEGRMTLVCNGQNWYRYTTLTEEEVLIYKMGAN
jgi:hypothetical protein